jgi:multidrug efflux system membrane fusion protein
MKQVARGVVTFLAVAAVGGLAHQAGWIDAANSQTAPARPQGTVPVRVASVTVKPTAVELNTIGSVQTIASVALKSRLDAVIDKVLVHDGQFVKAGDILFQLDSRAAQAQLEQAAAALARDQAQLQNAQRNIERDKPLLSKDFVSHQQFDTDSATGAALQATVQSDQAALENAKVLLSYYTIVAPLDGRVGLIMIKQGNSIKSNDAPLATVNQIQPIYVSFNLPQINLPDLRAAMAQGPVTVRVLPQGDKGPLIDGQVAFFDNAIDMTSGTINVRASFANDEQRLWPGQFVNVRVVVSMDANALVVPPAAVQVGQNGSYVFVIKDDNTAETRPVTVDRTVAGQAVISAGLAAGEKVVIDGQLRLSDGTRVQIVADGPQKAGDAS